MFREPETSHISPEQLEAEVKGIYGGLLIVETKYREVDAKLLAIAKGGVGEYSYSYNNGKWRALVSLHRCLLHEQQDFFLATQYPNAGPFLNSLVLKYDMLVDYGDMLFATFFTCSTGSYQNLRSLCSGS